ncbi:MAG: hypothetical protein ACRDNP_14085 [Gaiellaceae bacterium]
MSKNERPSDVSETADDQTHDLVDDADLRALQEVFLAMVEQRHTVTVADAHCPTCGILVPDLERVRAENEALKKQLEEKRLEVARADD